ncbi:MAG: ArsA-related P-loop ATPase [Thermoplasmataceae archaeon]
MIEAFVGKGGVGKSTISAAYARVLAEHGKTLLVSTDYMPSLRHIFTRDYSNITVMEISESDIAAEWKSRYGDQAYTIISEFADVGPEILDHIAASPGVAEEFMISRIVDLHDSGRYDYVVWDTPASSSTMHLLSLERDFYNHLGRDLKFLLSARSRIRGDRIGSILKEWQKLAQDVWNHMEKTRFFLVSTADTLSLIQAGEIQEEFRKLGLDIYGRILNRSDQTLPGYNLSIPELHGTVQDIVESMMGYMDRIFMESHTSHI